MPIKTQRNAICPCGSGKKYKKCCMLQKREKLIAGLERKDGVKLSLSWLNQHYKQPIESWVESTWLAGISDTERAGIANADPQIRNIHDVNLLEFLLSEGSFTAMEGETSPLTLVLEAGILNEEQCHYLAQIPSCPLQLYQVTACKAGESFTLQDALAGNDAASIVIADPYGSRMFDIDDTVALRLLQTHTAWETSGAIYHIPDAYVANLKSALLSVDVSKRAKVLIKYWLKLVAAHV